MRQRRYDTVTSHEYWEKAAHFVNKHLATILLTLMPIRSAVPLPDTAVA